MPAKWRGKLPTLVLRLDYRADQTVPSWHLRKKKHLREHIVRTKIMNVWFHRCVSPHLCMRMYCVRCKGESSGSYPSRAADDQKTFSLDFIGSWSQRVTYINVIIAKKVHFYCGEWPLLNLFTKLKRIRCLSGCNIRPCVWMYLAALCHSAAPFEHKELLTLNGLRSGFSRFGLFDKPAAADRIIENRNGLRVLCLSLHKQVCIESKVFVL